MAVVDIKVTPAGESITHAVVLKWLKPDGSAVRTGDPVCELETDKATKEEYAPANGVLAIKAQPGQKVAIGDVIGSVDPKGVATATAPVSPAAIQPAPVPPGGIASGPPTAAPVASAPGKTAAAETRMSPAARVLADTKGLDASAISPSDRGVVTKTEVLAHLEGGARQPGRSAIPIARPAGERETRVAMTTLRARIAERLLQAQQNAAILTTFNEADMSRVMELRNRYKETFQKKHGVGLGFMSFFVKACVEALRAFPSVNARIDGNDIVYNNHYSFGVAVSTERGLIVPVLRDCETLSFAGIELGIAELARKARDNKITVNDLQGGTFTITNGGIFGSLMSTPILNPPQSGILGMHTIQKRPVAVDDQVVIRPMMYLALSYDHRIIDGREAVSFLVRVKECIENPERLLLEV